jgi:hypothetical protein
MFLNVESSLLLFLEIEGSYFCSWRLKVLVLVIGGLMFLFLFLEVEGFFKYKGCFV